MLRQVVREIQQQQPPSWTIACEWAGSHVRNAAVGQPHRGTVGSGAMHQVKDSDRAKTMYVAGNVCG